MEGSVAASRTYTIRRPSDADLRSALDVVKAFQQANVGTATITEDVFTVNWKELDLEHDAWLAVDDAQRVVGFARLRLNPSAPRIFAMNSVHPDHRDSGIDEEFERLLQLRARELASQVPSDKAVVLREGIGRLNDRGRARLTANGYAFVRRFWEMAIGLENGPRPVVWPEGIRAATVERGQERAALEASNEAFRDHWDFAPLPFEQFIKYLDRPGRDDRSISFIAWDGDQIAGVCLNSLRRPGEGYVNGLSVRRPWRGRGLALALLVRSFNEFQRHGCTEAALGVDSENLTGATRLYERAGMHVANAFDLYEKVVRESVPS